MGNQLQQWLLIGAVCFGAVAVLIVLLVLAGVVAEFQEQTGIDQTVETVRTTPGPGGQVFAIMMNPLVWAGGLMLAGAVWVLGKLKL